MLTQILMFYAVGAVIIGLYVSTWGSISATFRGKHLPCERLVGAVFAGIIWPAALWQIVFPEKQR